jgi:hypothetical protein
MKNPQNTDEDTESLDEPSRLYWRDKYDTSDRSYIVFPVEHKPKFTHDS